MPKIKRGQPGYNAGKTVRKKNPKSKAWEKKLELEDDNKKRLKEEKNNKKSN